MTDTETLPPPVTAAALERSRAVEHRNPVLLKIVIYTALVFGMAAVPASIVANVRADRLATQRNTDRQNDQAAAIDQQVAQDVASCQSGNVLRQQIIDLAASIVGFQTAQLDLVLPGDSDNPRVVAVRSQLDVLLDQLGESAGQVRLRDCATAIKGAPKDTPLLPPG